MCVIRTESTLRQPDIQLMCNPVRMDAKVWWPLISRRQAHLLTSDAVLLHPKSRGRVSLRSADPAAKPRIEFNALAEPEDLATLRRGLRAARHIYRTSPQADLIEREVLPGADGGQLMPGWMRTSRHGRHDAASGRHLLDGGGHRAAWWIQNCGCLASMGCAWPMPRSCRPYRAATPTAPCS